MNQRIPCITDSDEFRFDTGSLPSSMDKASAIDVFTDELMNDCRVLHNAESINSDNDLYDGPLLSGLMVQIANWTGSIESSHERMKAMHNLLANELQKIAEREFA